MNAVSVAVPRAAYPAISGVLARALRPRDPITVSDWAERERVLTTKGSSKPGRWRNPNNPLLREPMDCMSKSSDVREVTLILPIQYGKTEFELNVLGYTMDIDPGPTMVVLPDDIAMNAWIDQKLASLIEGTPAVQRSLTSSNSRNAANQKAFKDFAGGQLFVDHAKTATRLTLKSIRVMLVDELDKFASALGGGEDPVELIKGRNTAFPFTYKRCWIGTTGIKGVSRLDGLYDESDQRRYPVPCPHCGHEQPLVWSGLHWNDDASKCWYVCRECACAIDEHEKTAVIARGRWVPEKPGRPTRGYRANCLYYQIGQGPRWLELVHMYRAAVRDPAKLQVFVQERLAESWEDPAMRKVKHELLADRAEPYRLRTAPYGVLAVTAGVDTQNNRLAVHIVGWGRGLQSWTLDYVELPGDPAEAAVWVSLVDLLNRGIEHEGGTNLRVEAVCIDAGGHRTEAVKNFVRTRPGGSHPLRRAIAIFGAVPNNAPVLSKGKLQDVNWHGQLDKRGVTIYHVGTVAVKHLLYSRIGADAEPKKVDGREVPKEIADRFVHLSADLPPEFFAGMVSETYNPLKNRFEKRTGVRNEPLDTWVYAYAATHHPELRLHRRSKAEWDAAEARLGRRLVDAPTVATQPVPRETKNVKRDDPAAPSAGGFGSSEWSKRL
ncbi:MAG: phage terminase large subunit family protein [Dokdonella sp.]|uniref:phage terminase large subunit family protein n=1 Tax=Dokdonella sp. TaxID=2291710 RepID=UPI003F7E3985